LARAVVDLSGRGLCEFSGTFAAPSVGSLTSSNVAHFFQSFARQANFTMHLDILRGENAHHKAEALFKAAALALKAALEIRPDAEGSTKGNAAIDLRSIRT
jgi:imidazoleglycerol-phosphate dehydratase